MSDFFEIEKLLAQTSHEHRYHEFLRIPSMSAGVYVLPAAATDGQKPHNEDEIYFVVRGKGKIRIAGKEEKIATGSVIFVDAKLEHHFIEIEEELVLLVIFAPAETD